MSSRYWANLFSQRADGAGQPERLTTQTGDRSAWGFTPDGQTLLYTQFNPATGWDVHVLSMERPYRSRPLLQNNSLQGSPALSSDGHWIAYRSDETERFEIFVRPFPNVDDGVWRVSTNGGTSPLWARSGRELFYQWGDSMMVVPVDTDPTFTHGEAKPLFSSGDYNQAEGVPNYDVSPDGQRFLMIRDIAPIEPSARDEVVVVLNWLDELKRLVPGK